MRTNIYEHSAEARATCIQQYGTKCAVCGFDFAKQFGNLGAGFIDVHHLKPVSEICKGYKLDPINDLRPVCPNCHVMLHKRKPEAYTIDELKAIIHQAAK